MIVPHGNGFDNDGYNIIIPVDFAEKLIRKN